MNNKFEELAKRPIIRVILIAYICIMVYYGSFGVPFHFDDVINILENPGITDIKYFINGQERAKLSKIASGVTEEGGAVRVDYSTHKQFTSRIFGYLTFFVNYKLNGLSVAGYHSVNILIHMLASFLLCEMVLLLYKTARFKDNSDALAVALFTGTVFAVHPVQTQAVTYIVQRFASLAGMFYIGSVMFYLKWRLAEKETHKVRRIIYYISTLVFLALGMLSKETMFTAPLAILMTEALFFDIGSAPLVKRIKPLIPFLLTMLIVPYSLAVNPIGSSLSDFEQSTKLSTNMPRWDYLITQFRVIATYIRLIFLPVNQMIDYDYQTYKNIFEPAVLASLAFLCSVFALGIYFLKRNRLVSFGIFWFFLGLSVESSFVPINDVIFEHRLYLPLAGAVLAVVGGVFHASETLMPVRRKTIIIALSICVLILSFATIHRNTIWATEVGLWEDSARKAPMKTRVVHNLGVAYDRAGMGEKAIETYNRVLTIDPDNTNSINGLGVIYFNRGEIDRSFEYCVKALRLAPERPDLHNNIGLIYYSKGKYDKAEEEFRNAIRLLPTFTLAYYHLGMTQNAMGRVDEAIASYEKALELKPLFPKANIEIGVALRSVKQYDRAIKHLTIATIIWPEDVSAQYELGMTYRAAGNREKGDEFLKRAIELNPSFVLRASKPSPKK